jgi:membrane-bound lytic murein transglycosylase F
MTRSLPRLALAAGAALLAGSGFAQDLAAIKQSGRLRVLAVAVPEGPRFISGTPGEGFDGEILAGFARLQGVSVEMVTVESWDALIPALLKGRGDLIAGGFTDTTARRAQIDFTHEVFPTRDVVITRRPTPPITTLDQLKKVPVGVIKGTSMADALSGAGVSRVEATLAPGSVPAALREKKVAAAVDGLEAALVASQHDPDLQIGLFLGSAQSLAYGVRKDSGQLLSSLNEYLGNVRKSPAWSRMVVKYFGPSAPEILRRARE